MAFVAAKALAFLLVVRGAVASPHGHARHLHPRAHAIVARQVTPRQVTVTGAGIPMITTEIIYELAGHAVPYNEVMEGIANGTLIWAQAPPPAPPTEPTAAPPTFEAPPTAVPQPPTVQASPPQTGSVGTESIGSPSTGYWDPNGVGIDADFPDGELDCSTFPSEYGAINVDWLELGGWSGIQSPKIVDAAGYDDIMTIVPSLCVNGVCCAEGAFCSYACPAGYQKSQWPSLQGRTGQSVGGLQCRGGKLWLTNKELASTLCIPGTSAVRIQAHNRLGSQVAVCRTDYPGTESETIPLLAAPGNLYNITCPDAARYYKAQGLDTSAQYYINPAGVGVQDACQWGDGSRPVGNFAPLNIGVGYGDTGAFISMFPNKPTTNTLLDFTVEILGDDDGWDNLSSRCKYSQGMFCSGDGYSQCNPDGCTVALTYGTATYVFSV